MLSWRKLREGVARPALFFDAAPLSERVAVGLRGHLRLLVGAVSTAQGSDAAAILNATRNEDTIREAERTGSTSSPMKDRKPPPSV